MVGVGAKPGEYRGGRSEGTPNRKTVEDALKLKRTRRAATIRLKQQIKDEKTLAAEVMLARWRQEVRPLAKEVLDKFMLTCCVLASKYEPKPDTPVSKLSEKRLAQFERWSKNAMEFAKALAPYQSPTFRAIVVAPAPETGKKTTRFAFTIFENQRGQAQVIEHKPDKPNGGENA